MQSVLPEQQCPPCIFLDRKPQSGVPEQMFPHLGVGACRQRLFALGAAEAGPVPVLSQRRHLLG